MAATETTKAANVSQRWRRSEVVGRLLGSRRVLAIASILIAAGVVIIAAANWSWLLASGIASILFSVLPCVVMCGLGLCMYKLGSGGTVARPIGSTATGESADPTAVPSGDSATGDLSCCSSAHYLGPAMVPTKVGSLLMMCPMMRPGMMQGGCAV